MTHSPASSPAPWLEVLHPDAPTGHTRYALFDFDGTLSVVRRGWEKIMIALMIETICPGQPCPPEIETEVADYVDRSTGILTIKQMQWLAQAARRHGRAAQVRSAAEYKRIYNERLLSPVRARLKGMRGDNRLSRDGLMIAGARAFLEALARRGVRLFLASGTDHQYVEEEAAALGVADYFEGRIYGARGDSEDDSKELVIARILAENRLNGEELLVVGDGPVEIRYGRQSGAVTLGVAADEDDRLSLNPRKRDRLAAADADLLVANFQHAEELAQLLCGLK